MAADHRRCAQCGHPLKWPDVRPLIPAGEDTGDNALVCKDTGACRQRWWAEFAYKGAFSPQ